MYLEELKFWKCHVLKGCVYQLTRHFRSHRKLMALKDMSLKDGRTPSPHGHTASTFLILLVCTNHSLTHTHLKWYASFWFHVGIPSHSILLDKEGAFKSVLLGIGMTESMEATLRR